MTAMPYDIIGYTYKTDNYCPDCILHKMMPPGYLQEVATEQALDLIATGVGLDRQDQRSFDSGDFPKVVFRDQLLSPEDDAHPEHCGRCGVGLDR